MSLNDQQLGFLLRPLQPNRVQKANGQSHVAAWDIRRHLLRVFGWGGWDFHVVTCDVVSERSKWDDKDPLKGRHTVVYRVVGRLTIRDPQGTTLATFEDGATGAGTNQPSLADAHDMAMKTAMSQALKRCAVNLGDGFGLSLYDRGSADAVVWRSLAHESSTEPGDMPTRQVEAGDDDMHGQVANPTTGEIVERQHPRKVSELDAERNPDDPEAERQARLAEAKVRRDAAGVDSSGKKAKGQPTAERFDADTLPADDPWAVSGA